MTGVDISVQPPVVQSNITVNDSTIQQNEHNGFTVLVKDGASVDFLLSNSRVTANGNYGLSTRCTDPLTRFHLSLLDNTISDNGLHGITSAFYHSTDNSLTVSGNRIQNHTTGSISISVSGAKSDIDIGSNLISDYNYTGIGISLSSDIPDSRVQIRSNEIYNGNDGITVKDSVDGSIQVEISDNTIFNHLEGGIEIYKNISNAPSMQASISGNRIFANGENGIELRYAEYSLDETRRGDIEADITLNTIYDNGGYGLHLLTNDPLDVMFNTIFDNSGGIYLKTRDNTFVNYNDIYDNGSGFALEMSPLSQINVDARFNYWGTMPTAQMNTGPNPQNIDVIFDDFDDSVLGTVDYAGWLGQSIATLDTDADALTDRQEFEIGTDPQDSDTDDDLASDGVEVRSGSDPSDDQSLPYTLYEDAEDESTAGWFVYAGDGSSAVIENVIDSDRDGRVISLSGSGVDHGYALFDSDGTEWNNTAEFMAEWHLKYSEPYVVYIEVQTTAGRRYLQYTPVDYSSLGDGATIHHGVGAHTIDGAAWHMLTRDLDADLKEAQPELDILAVNAFLIRGSGLVDDIKLSSHTADSDLDGLADISETGIHGTDPILTDTDGDGLTDSAEINDYGTNPNEVDSDQDGIADQAELALWENDAHLDSDNDSLPNLLDADSDNDGIVDGEEIDRGTDPADALSAPLTVYEDAEAIDTDGWFVYSGDPGSAAIANVEDVEGGNRAIDLNGDGQIHGYALYGDNYVPWQNERQFIIEWRLKFNEFFTVYVEVQTTAGRRYLQYTPVDYDNLGTGSIVHHGVGFNSMDGSWRRFIRNLADDLNSVQPDAVLQSVEGYLIRGSGRIDDIKLWTAAPDTDGDGLTDLEENNIYYTSDTNGDTDGDGLTDSAEINDYGTNPNEVDSDQDGIADQAELALWENDAHLDSDNDSLPNLLDADSDDDGIVDGTEIDRGTDPADALSAPPTVYEDAEAIDTDGWFVYTGNPGSAAITNVEDVEGGNRAIDLNGDGQIHGYALYGDNYVPWQNERQFIIEWRLKFNEFFTVYVEVQTTAGRRYLQYTPVDYDNLGTGSIVHHGVGFESMDGSWRRFIRNLVDDLNSVQPDAVLQSVEGYLIRGSGRIDDIKLWTAAPDTDGDGLTDLEENNIYYTSDTNSDTDGDGLTDSAEINDYGTNPNEVDSDQDGIADQAELALWENDAHLDSDNDSLPNLLDADSDDDGIVDGEEIDRGTDPADALSAPPTVYEDAEAIDTDGWFVYSGDPGSAAIANVEDVEGGNRAIDLNGDGQIHGYALYGDNYLPWQNDRQFIIEWRLKFNEFFTVYVEVQTTAGRRYLKYTPVDYDNLGTGSIVHHGVGFDSMDGSWRRFIRNLADDLNSVQPEAVLQSVEGVLIRGSGRIDDIKLWTVAPDTDGDGLTDLEENNIYYTSDASSDTDGDGISDSEEITDYSTDPTAADTDADGSEDGTELAFWQLREDGRWNVDYDGDGLVNLVDPDSDDDGVPDGVEISLGSDPEDESDSPASVYEDAEDEQTVRWDIYDGDQATGSIVNVPDSERGNQVIALAGESTMHGFRLGTETSRQWKNTAQFTLDLGIKFSEYYIIYVDVQTSNGHRYLKYTPSDYSDLGGGEYVHHGLGWDSRNGQWHDVTIDLLSDLQEAQPEAAIIEVNGLLIRGSGRIDDVRLRN